MQKTRIIVFLLIAVLLISIVSARSWYLIRTPDQQRDIYFGNTYTKLITENEYTKPLSGYGLKDFSGSPRGAGFKGMESLQQNLPYNSFITRGRDPSHISNWDPQIRGYTIMNIYVELEPVDPSIILEQGKLFLPGMQAGAARIISNREKGGDMFKTTIYLQARDLVGLGTNEVYEAWLVDEDTAYPLSLGIFVPATYGGLSSMNFEFDHYVHNYDMIMITREPFPDKDPNPGEVILIGDLTQVRKADMSLSQESYYTQ